MSTRLAERTEAIKNVTVAFDPGFAQLGCAAHLGEAVWMLKLITTPPCLGFNDRLADLRKQLLDFLAAAGVAYGTRLVVAIERQDQVAASQSKRGATDRNVLLVQQVVGLLKCLALELGAELVEIDPKVAKRALAGSQKATKAQMRRAAQRRLRMSDLPSEHEADAIAVAVVAEGKVRLSDAVARYRRAT